MSTTQKRMVRVCAVCGSRPNYSLHLESEWIACPKRCTMIKVKNGCGPEELETRWNASQRALLISPVADAPFDSSYDPATIL